MQHRFKSVVASFLALMMLAVSLSPAYAGIMSTTDAIQLELGQIERAEIATLLDRADVRDQLSALGVDPDDAKQRVAAMTDEQVQELNQRLEELPAGSSFGTVIAVVLIVFIVFIITDAVGATDIFPFVKPVK